ncbi:MAG TPA: TolC family protein, partial [Terriglobales bacterium]|nr:TolC family protein [Terriglobales bacterium]
EQDVRAALLSLQSTADQVTVAQQGQDLAERELKLTQDRFRSGVTNNIEVTTAQDELARAAGGTEKNMGQYLGNP